MAKRSTPAGSTALVIVESPAKARTISKFLGRGFQVEASIGHVRDLPNGAKEVPEKFKGQPWAYLGVNVAESFAPVYIVPSDKKDQVRKLKAALKESRELYLATDEDREGEAISWHLHEILQPKVPVRRLVFHEITEEAIQEALSHPRAINDGLVRAQETRRILDRLFGYEVSPLLWRKVRRGLSAGRVQSVAVRMIVEREQARREFTSAEYWDLWGEFLTVGQQSVAAQLVRWANRRLAAGRDFGSNGKLQTEECVLLDRQAAESLVERLRSAAFEVTKVEEKPFTNRPSAPFTTSTLQQEANRKLGFAARRTMSTAQSLYENGYITYMRTDSTNLATVAVNAARELVLSEYGRDFLPAEPRVYKSKVKNAQEAHEAIRPAGHPFRVPSTMKQELNPDQFRLFELIWKRTIASQMADARGRRVVVTIQAEDAVFQASGSTIDFPGYLRAYVEGSDDPEAELADKETILPPLQNGDRLRCDRLEPKQHQTQSPARFTEASLTKALEELGIGRPSTYASIIETIQQRQYVFKKGNSLIPSWMAFSVSKLLLDHLPKLVDYQFTAKMEDDLDAISRGEAEHTDYLRKFYFGNGTAGLKPQLEKKGEEIDARDVSRFLIGTPGDSNNGEAIYVRVGRFGPFLEQGDRRASLPEDLPPDELTIEAAVQLLDKAAQGDTPLGYCPDTERPVYVKVGRYGPYVQLGDAKEDEKPKNASLLKGMEPDQITLDVALRLLSLPRTLGKHPASGEDVVAYNGRYGPYVKCGNETRSLPAELSPIDVNLEQALGLLAQPKTRGRRAASKEPLKLMDKSPVTGSPIQVLDGRYGPYVTDGTTNASLPRDASPEELTMEVALQLLADRAAKGPAKKKRTAARKKPAAAKKTNGAPKKATKKKAAKSNRQ